MWWLKGKRRSSQYKPLLSPRNVEERDGKKKQLKKEEPRGLELYRRRCKKEGCIYIHFFLKRTNLYLQEARTISKSFPKSVV